MTSGNSSTGFGIAVFNLNKWIFSIVVGFTCFGCQAEQKNDNSYFYSPSEEIRVDINGKTSGNIVWKNDEFENCKTLSCVIGWDLSQSAHHETALNIPDSLELKVVGYDGEIIDLSKTKLLYYGCPALSFFQAAFNDIE